MQLKPRHKKIIIAIGRHQGPCCDNVVSQASGVSRTIEACLELEKAGWIVWRRPWGQWRENGYPSGWVLTKKGHRFYKAYDDILVARIRKLVSR